MHKVMTELVREDMSCFGQGSGYPRLMDRRLSFYHGGHAQAAKKWLKLSHRLRSWAPHVTPIRIIHQRGGLMTALAISRLAHSGRVSSPQPQAPECLVRIHCNKFITSPPRPFTSRIRQHRSISWLEILVELPNSSADAYGVHQVPGPKLTALTSLS